MSNIKTREEIIEIIYNAFNKRCDSVVEINNPTTKESIYLTLYFSKNKSSFMNVKQSLKALKRILLTDLGIVTVSS